MYHGLEVSDLPLDKPPSAVGTLVGLVSTVDLPVSIEGAWVCQLLAADLTGDGRLAVGVHGGQGVAVACSIKSKN